MMKNWISWKIFFYLLAMSLLSIVCVFPYVMSIQGELLRTIGLPIAVIFFAQLLQSALLFSFAIFFGLLLSKKIGFQLPVLEALVAKGNYKKIWKDIFEKSVLAGVAVGAILYGLDVLFTFFGAGITTHQRLAPIWQTLLASFYGGITEEILMRLFLMTLFIWVSMKLFKQSKPSTAGTLTSIFLAAIIFGLGHLPITASLTKITPLVVSRAIVLNGIGGVVFGWLYWKKGLESAMIAHFTTDVVLLSLLPLFIS
jgi:membrane protease YdiL (CAAX protease family)